MNPFDKVVRSQKDMAWAVLNESRPYKSANITGANNAPGASTPGTTTLSISFQVPPGKLMWLEGFFIGLDSDAFYNGTLQHANGGFDYNIIGGYLPKGSHFIPYKGVIHELASVSLYGATPYGSTVVSRGSILPVGRLITNDRHYAAQYTYALCGDSIAEMTGGNDPGNALYAGYYHYAPRLVKAMRANGIDVRYVNYGEGGITSAGYLKNIQSGVIDFSGVDFMSLALGMNDAASVVTSTYTDNIKGILDIAWAQNPKLSVLLLGVTPSDARKTNSVDNIPGYNTALSLIPAMYPSRDIIFADPTTGMTAPGSASATYYVETSSGQKVHPRFGTGNGMDDLYNNVVLPKAQLTQFWIKKGSV